MRLSNAIPIAFFLLSAPAVGYADITTGLVGRWEFSGNALDTSGFGNHGTPNAAATLTTDRFGTPNSAYHFDGLSARIDIPTSASLESPTTALTMAAWIRRDGWGMVGQQYSPILTKSTSAPNDFQYRFITSSTGLGTALNNWNTSHAAPFAFDIDEWMHVASTWESDTLRSYVDGHLIDTASLVTTIQVDTHDLSLGSDVPGVLEVFWGDLDDVRIYDRALSEFDIAELADLPTPAAVAIRPEPHLELGHALPNPLTAAAEIPFALPRGTDVSLAIFDPRGRRVRTLAVGRPLGAGSHRMRWDGRDRSGNLVAAGVYFVRLTTPEESASEKIVVRR